MLPIKGVHIVRSKGRVYVYAWRGGPRLTTEPGSPEFTRELADALAARSTPDRSRMAGLVALYRASDDWKDLADKTRKNWVPFLDSIQTEFGKISIAAFDRPLIRVAIRKWRDGWKDRPRQADMALQVLSRILTFGMAEGKLVMNACSGIPRLYASDRSDIIWTDDDLKALAKHASAEVMMAVRLAALTGLRKGDLLKLSWNHITNARFVDGAFAGGSAIEIRTGKSRGKKMGRARKEKTAIIPIYAELRDHLATIPKRATTILTSTDKISWKTGFDASFIRAKTAAGLEHLHFHDLRGTAATRHYLGGQTIREIADTFTWSEDYVERLINAYVKKDELIRDRIRRLDEHASRLKGKV